MEGNKSSFFKAAKSGDNSIAMYLIAFVVIVLGYMLGQAPLTVTLLSAIRKQNDADTDAYEAVQTFSTDMNFERFGIDSNLGFFLLLLTFIGGMFALYLMVTNAHKKRFMQLVKPAGKLGWSKMLFCFSLWIALTAVFEYSLSFFGYNEYSFQFDFMAFLPLLLISVFILPIQTSFEELLFRGYYLQGFSLIFKNKWVPLLITSLLFGLVHSANPEITKYGFYSMQLYYIGVGLFLGILTILDDSLEIALGIHAATNFYGACLVGYEGSAIQTASLFKSGTLDTTAMLFGFLFIAIIFYIIVSKRYHLPSIRYVFHKLDFNEHTT